MKLIEKLKNVFFEEVPDDEDEEELPQTFAKKIEVPKKKPEVEVKEEYKPVVEEKIEPKQEILKEEEIPVEVPVEKEPEKTFPMMFDDDDFLADKTGELKFDLPKDEPVYHRSDVHQEEKELYQGKKELSYVESVRKPSYTYTKSYYEEKETKGFKPSPIISPIYGILDKNYRKEEVVTKRETRITSGRTNFDLDTVRNKAFGNDDEVTSPKEKEVHEDEPDKRIYDVNNNKPQVNRVTLADADEYYNDLGLAYNVDYSDASRTAGSRTAKYGNKEKKKDKNVDDNLFDLIDSMYSKED